MPVIGAACMNKSIHSDAILILGLISWQLAVLGVAYFLGREIAQAEYRWIEHYGKGLRANMPWYAPLDLRLWDVHSWWWNLALPILVAGLIVIFVQ